MEKYLSLENGGISQFLPVLATSQNEKILLPHKELITLFQNKKILLFGLEIRFSEDFKLIILNRYWSY